MKKHLARRSHHSLFRRPVFYLAAFVLLGGLFLSLRSLGILPTLQTASINEIKQCGSRDQGECTDPCKWVEKKTSQTIKSVSCKQSDCDNKVSGCKPTTTKQYTYECSIKGIKDQSRCQAEEGEWKKIEGKPITKCSGTIRTESQKTENAHCTGNITTTTNTNTTTTTQDPTTIRYRSAVSCKTACDKVGGTCSGPGSGTFTGYTCTKPNVPITQPVTVSKGACGAGLVPTQPGYYVSTGAGGYTDEQGQFHRSETNKNQRECVYCEGSTLDNPNGYQLNSNKKAVTVACDEVYKKDKTRVILPPSAGCEYTQGQKCDDTAVTKGDTTYDGSALQSCVGSNGPVPTGTQQGVKYCWNGGWVEEGVFNSNAQTSLCDSATQTYNANTHQCETKPAPVANACTSLNCVAPKTCKYSVTGAAYCDDPAPIVPAPVAKKPAGATVTSASECVSGRIIITDTGKLAGEDTVMKCVGGAAGDIVPQSSYCASGYATTTDGGKTYKCSTCKPGADPNDPTGRTYLTCDTTGKTTLVSCPVGQNYDNATKACKIDTIAATKRSECKAKGTGYVFDETHETCIAPAQPTNQQQSLADLTNSYTSEILCNRNIPEGKTCIAGSLQGTWKRIDATPAQPTKPTIPSGAREVSSIWLCDKETETAHTAGTGFNTIYYCQSKPNTKPVYFCKNGDSWQRLTKDDGSPYESLFSDCPNNDCADGKCKPPTPAQPVTPTTIDPKTLKHVNTECDGDYASVKSDGTYVGTPACTQVCDKGVDGKVATKLVDSKRVCDTPKLVADAPAQPTAVQTYAANIQTAINNLDGLTCTVSSGTTICKDANGTVVQYARTDAILNYATLGDVETATKLYPAIANEVEDCKSGGTFTLTDSTTNQISFKCADSGSQEVKASLPNIEKVVSPAQPTTKQAKNQSCQSTSECDTGLFCKDPVIGFRTCQPMEQALRAGSDCNLLGTSAGDGCAYCPYGYKDGKCNPAPAPATSVIPPATKPVVVTPVVKAPVAPVAPTVPAAQTPVVANPPVVAPAAEPADNPSITSLTNSPDFVYCSQRGQSWSQEKTIDGCTWEEVSCGIMSGAMVTGQQGGKCDPYYYSAALSKSYNLTCQGSGFFANKAALERLGYTAIPVAGSTSEIKEQIERYAAEGVPVWINAYIAPDPNSNAWIGHNTIAVGVSDNGDIIFNDPWYGENVTIPDERIDIDCSQSGCPNGNNNWIVYAFVPPGDN